VVAAAYALTFQLGVVTTQLCEAVSLAMQSLLSRELTRVQRALEVPGDSAAAFGANARHVVLLGVFLGGGLAGLLSALTWLGRGAAVRALTSNAPVGALCVAVMPAVLICQCLKGLAYPANAVLMGGCVCTCPTWPLSARDCALCLAVFVCGPVSSPALLLGTFFHRFF
jgi:Na+-driven multidrug efflux pump